MKYTCPICNNQAQYDSDYDAYWCIECMEWMSEICSDYECSYCKNRPLDNFMDKIHDKIIKAMDEK